MSGADAARLLKLADRVEREKPSRELDCHIHAAVVVRAPVHVIGPPAYDERRFFARPESSSFDWLGYDLLNVSPAYTTSVDAALMLSAPGLHPDLHDWTWAEEPYWSASIQSSKGSAICKFAKAQTPAAALCAASLRARAAMMEKTDG